LALLEVNRVKKSFGGLEVLKGVSLEIEAGKIIGLVGPNGSGKTTLFNLIFGLFKPNAGHIYFRQKRIEGLPPHQIYALGLAFVFQLPRLFLQLTVLDNLILAAREQVGVQLGGVLFCRRRWQRQEAALAEKAYQILELLEMTSLATNAAQELSGGQRKLLEIGRALMTDPVLVLLDEPAAGVNPVLGQKIYRNMKMLAQRGLSFLVIEHKLEMLFNFAHYIYVMDKGNLITSGEPQEVIRSPLFYSAYLGEEEESDVVCFGSAKY
jgi:branched-chain amino acid transport system ATP-binding protein